MLCALAPGITCRYGGRVLATVAYRGARYRSSMEKKSEMVKFDELPSIITPSAKGPKISNSDPESVPRSLENGTVDLNDQLASIPDDRGAKTDKPAHSSLFKTIKTLMDRYKDYVVLVQVGSFYELYFESAEKYGPICDLKVTQRYYKTTGYIPFAGFPLASLNKYLKILVNDHGYSVAIADQFGSLLETGKISRRVARIVTPGTLIDEALRNFQHNNYLLAISFPEDPCKRVANGDTKIGLAWSDVALGDFFVQETTLKSLMTDISRIKPSEILLDEELEVEKLDAGKWYPELSELKRYYLKYQHLPSRQKPLRGFYDMFNDTTKTLDVCFNELSQKEISASISILHYISENLPESEPNLALPERQMSSNLMQIDSRTSDALELHQTFRDNKRTGSLLSSIKHTVTAAGTRLLSTWISAPSTSLTEIRKRQKFVDLLRKNGELRSQLVARLKTSSDISRIVQRLSLGRVDVSELSSLAKTLYSVNDIKGSLNDAAQTTKSAQTVLKPVMNKLNAPLHIADRISAIIDEEAIARYLRIKDLERERLESGSSEIDQETNDDHALNAEEWVVRKDANPVLRNCHDEYENLLDQKEKFLQVATGLFKEQHGCRNIELQLHKVYGYVVCVTGSAKVLSSLTDIPSSYHLLYSTKQARFFYHKQWKYIGTDIQSHVDRIRSEEERILSALRREILQMTFEIRSVAHCLDYIDVIGSFAALASEQNLTMPKMKNSNELKIINGRHIVVEEGLKETSQQFIPNDCRLNSNCKEQLWIISGPNMGGKSTFLRQNATIVILAQIGSFVPAEEAVIGIVDKVFSRVGSADDLYRELSTFMVEMVETGFILKNATSNSLAVLDEVGRGTSGKEGLAIAFATLLYLLKFNNCRTLFATHFGSELSKLLQNIGGDKEKIGYYHTSMETVEGSDKFLFNHRLQRGISEKSHAIEVAELSGLPKEAIAFARESLISLEKETK